MLGVRSPTVTEGNYTAQLYSREWPSFTLGLVTRFALTLVSDDHRGDVFPLVRREQHHRIRKQELAAFRALGQTNSGPGFLQYSLRRRSLSDSVGTAAKS